MGEQEGVNFIDGSEIKVGDFVRKEVIREGVLEKIVERHVEDCTFYDNGKPQEPYCEQWTRLRITFNGSDEPEDIIFPSHIYLPMRVLPRPIPIRYTMESTDYVSQEKLDLYEALQLEFCTFDSKMPSQWDEQWDDIDPDLFYDENRFLAVESDRTVKRRFEVLAEDGNVAQAYSHTTFKWDVVRWACASAVIPDEEPMVAYKIVIHDDE